MSKRIFLFVLTNLLVIATLTMVFQLFSHTRFGARLLGQSGGMQGLIILCAFWGMGGSFISLMLSKWMAKHGTGAVVIDAARATGDERWLLDTVHRLARQVGINDMPEVAIYPSQEINAFATGPSKNSALVAVSAGLLNRMSRDEVEGVLGHEISHVANGDMVTMTLVQGVVNAFVMFAAYVLAIAVSQALRGKDERESGWGAYLFRSMLIQVFQVLFGLAAYVMVVAPFSRWREYRADAGGAKVSGRQKMILALQALKESAGVKPREPQPQGLAAFKISGGVASLFATHPSLDDRIARLKQVTVTH